VQGDAIVEVKRRDSTGREISTFYGKHTFIYEMKRPARWVKSFAPHGGAVGPCGELSSRDRGRRLLLAWSARAALFRVGVARRVRSWSSDRQ
jgi:hypothetical protein